MKWVTFWKVLTSEKMLRKVFSVSYWRKARARLLKVDVNRKVLGVFQMSELICLVLLYNSPSLLTEWVKHSLKYLPPIFLKWNSKWYLEIHFKVIFFSACHDARTELFLIHVWGQKESVCDTLSGEVLQLFLIHPCSRYTYNFNRAAPVYDVLLWCFSFHVYF